MQRVSTSLVLVGQATTYHKPLEAYEFSYAATDLEKKRKKKKNFKKRARKKKRRSSPAISKKGDVEV